jgi:uncharacterized membrane protein
MKRDANLSPLDRVVRVVLGIALLGIGVFVVRGVVGVVVDLVGAVLIFSGVMGFCHIYKVCGLSTAKKA